MVCNLKVVPWIQGSQFPAPSAFDAFTGKASHIGLLQQHQDHFGPNEYSMVLDHDFDTIWHLKSHNLRSSKLHSSSKWPVSVGMILKWKPMIFSNVRSEGHETTNRDETAKPLKRPNWNPTSDGFCVRESSKA